MTGVRWPAAFLALFLAAAELPAQGIIISSGNPYYGYPVGGAYISFGHGHFHGHAAFPLSGYYGPFGYNYSYTSSQVTVVYSPPPQVVVIAPEPDDLTLELLRERLRDDDAPLRPPSGEQRFGGF